MVSFVKAAILSLPAHPASPRVRLRMPTIPGTEGSDLEALLCVHIATLYHSGLGHRLVTQFGSGHAVLRQSDEALVPVEGCKPRALGRLRSRRTRQLAREELRIVEREGIHLLVRGSPEYPNCLAELEESPLVLFARGDLSAIDRDAVGIIGTRHPSAYAERQADRFASAFARLRRTVVSGFARGVDVRAQRAALEAGGRTLAVLGSGLGKMYPPEHVHLAEDLVRRESGALLTEFPFRTSPRSFHFPQRNRLLSGLSRALLVVEAGVRSGSLITVRWALDQGRSVFVVPGRVDQEGARGGLELLREGAAAAVDPQDLFRELNLPLDADPDSSTTCSELPGPLPGPLGASLSRLFDEEDCWHPDAIVEKLALTTGDVIPRLVELELAGHLTLDAAGRYRRRSR